MFDWEDLRHFLAVAQAGSLSGGARALRVDHATVSRRLSALEAHLEVRLVDRRARSTELTALGRQVFEQAMQMEAAAFAIERAARADQTPLSGRVTVSAPPVLATNFLAGEVFAFRQQYPDIQLSIASQAQAVSLSRREADIAVRLVRPTGQRDVARKLGQMPFALYAHKRYAQLRKPAQWEFIGYDAQYVDMPHQKWIALVAGERRIVCEVSDITSQLAAARTGIGVAALPCFMGDAAAELQRLPFDGEVFAPTLWMVVHDDLRHSPALNAVMAFIVEALARSRVTEG